jgi:hypothetical protein
MPKNNNNKISLDALKQLLSRFFDKDFEIPDDELSYAAQYLSGEARQPVTKGHPELQETLNYLRNVMHRNHFRELEDLFNYYEKKRSKIAGLFKKLEETNPEEFFAISFRQACTLYMRIIPNEYKFKSDGISYLQEEECGGGGLRSVAGMATLEDEIQYLSQVEGNKLVQGSEERCICRGRINEQASN